MKFKPPLMMKLVRLWRNTLNAKTRSRRRYDKEIPWILNVLCRFLPKKDIIDETH